MAYITKKQTNNGVKPIGSNLFGSCSTASGTAAKVVTMPDFDVLVEGVTIHVYFASKNTASNPTLQVGSAEAKPIMYNGIADGSWEDGGFISFTYHNGYWHQNDITVSGVTYTFTISGHTMTISGSDGSVQTVTLPDDNTTYTLTKSGNTITLTGSDGSTASVTDENTTYGLSFNNGVLSLVPSGNTPSVTLPDEDTTYTISINDHTITLTPSSGTAQTITIPDDDTTYTISISGDVITLTGSDGSTSTVTVPSNGLRYVADVINSPETYGVVINDVTGNVASGNYATAEGLITIASGECSHAEGNLTTASGNYSHSEGAMTSAAGGYSHAEGAGTQANGSASHAEGNTTHAFGNYSHASGDHITALGESQTAFGKYNDPKANYVLIIGGGTDANNLLNIFTVDWSGNVRALGLVNEVLIYDKVNKLHVQGTIGSGKDGANGLINQDQGEGLNRDITSWNIEGMDLSAFRRLRIVYRRASDTLGSTGEFYLPIEGDAIPTRSVYQSGCTAPAHCNRNRLNTIACAVDSTKSKFCVTQTFSLYGTAATTVSDMYVERIYGCY